MTQTALSSGRSRRPAAGRPRIAVAGIHGYGGSHVLNALALEAAGRASVVGLVDPVGGAVVREGITLSPADLPPVYPTITALIEAVDVDIVTIATPLQTHAQIAIAALEAGADVLLEKPPVTDLDDFSRLTRVQRATGGHVQVGFQSLGSHALEVLLRYIRDGVLGEIVAIGAAGSWTRDRGYWTRSAWAGRRELNGVRVADGAVSNPFAHALMTALHVAGWDTPEAITDVESDLRHVNPIQTDDTSSLRIRASEAGAAVFNGFVTCAFTLAGPREQDPFVLVRGSRGTARLFYTTDKLWLDDESSARCYGRDDLLENLIEARQTDATLISPLERSGGFVRVIDQLFEQPLQSVDPSYVNWEGTGERARPVLAGIEATVTEAIERELLFRELPNVRWTL
jgi:predicted dehydrogenase